jgi:hypothetical protein
VREEVGCLKFPVSLAAFNVVVRRRARACVRPLLAHTGRSPPDVGTSAFWRRPAEAAQVGLPPLSTLNGPLMCASNRGNPAAL